MMKCKYEGIGVHVGRCMGTKEIDPCIGYDRCNQFKGEYVSNGDRIRAMSDEELATILAIITKHGVCMNASSMGCDECPFCAFCSDCIEGSELEWLKQPAKETKNA